MASTLLKKAIFSNPEYVRKTLGIFCNAARNHWNYQYKPGPYPTTPEEVAAAAKKYGMTLEEYKPYPESECYGDYPKLPNIGADSRDPHYPWDFPEIKRNFNEPINARNEIFGGDRYDPSMKLRFSVLYQAVFLFSVLGGFLAVFLYLEDYKIGRPVLAKQMPGQGKHFHFCPV